MNKYWSGLVAAGVMAVSASVAGQSQNPANTPPRDAASPAGVQRTPDAPSAQTRTPGNIVTISGCIQNAPAMTANTGAGAAGNANPAGSAGAGATTNRSTTGGSSFVLANASMAGAGSASATRGAVGTSGTASTYRLDGDSSTLSAHVNHQVRVTGMVQDSAASPTGAANANANATAAGPTLRVETVTMVADTCTGAAGAPGASGPNQGAQPQGNRPAGAGGGNTTPGSNQGNTTRPQP